MAQKKRSGLSGLLMFLSCVCLVNGCSCDADKPVIGREAPDFVYQRLGGTKQSLGQFRGKVVLLRFWAGWCPHCTREMPIIENFYQGAKDRGFVVLAVNVRQPRADVEAFVREFKLSFPVALDEDAKIALSYDVKGIPSHFLIDREGILRKVYLGPIGDEKMLGRFLEPLL
jgi:peroxiredoxin